MFPRGRISFAPAVAAPAPGPTAALLAAALLMGAAASSRATTTPLAETVPMPPGEKSDVADGVCAWVHPHDGSRSVVFGASKAKNANGGLFAFGIDGGCVTGSSWQAGVNWFDTGRKINVADVRYNFRAGDQTWDILCAANRTTDTIDVFRIDTDAAGDFAGLTTMGTVAPQHLDDDFPYGLAMFQPRSLDKYYVIVSDKDGLCEQFELTYDAGSDRVVGTSVWHGDVSGDRSEVEGIVADDEREVVYIAAERTNLYRYPTGEGVILSAGRVIVDSTAGPNLTADIEGLGLYNAPDGAGYLIASSQGSDDFAVYERALSASTANAAVMTFRIGAGDGIDAVSDTDGVCVVNADLGGPFRHGMFIAHDGGGPDSPTNFKFVDWSDVADEITPNLIIDTTWDARSRNLVVSAETVRTAAFAGADTVTVEGTLVLGGASDCRRLRLAPNGLLDVADSSILIRDGSLSAVLAEVIEGRSGGGWDGSTGITSSMAAGAGSPDLAVGVIETPEGVLAALALVGDAGLDGDVDFIDYVTTKGSFGTPAGAGWADGDGDFDGDVDFMDYVATKGNFGASVTGRPTSPGGDAAPEPAALPLLALAALALPRPRRRAHDRP